jgi:hypothetical protein
MARRESEFNRDTFARAGRVRTPERRVDDYRRAFVLLCEEPFDDLDKTLARMLECLAITLDVGRVSFWTFEEPQQIIRCEHMSYRLPELLRFAVQPARDRGRGRGR